MCCCVEYIYTYIYRYTTIVLGKSHSANPTQNFGSLIQCSGIWKQERLDDCVTVRTFSRFRPTPGLTYFPLLGGMCDHVMPSWSSIARSRLVRVAVHPDAHLRCLGSRSRMAGRPPTLWAAGPHRQSTDHFQCLGQGTAPSHLAQNVQAHEGRSLRGAHEAPLVEGTDYSN